MGKSTTASEFLIAASTPTILLKEANGGIVLTVQVINPLPIAS